MRLTKRDLKLMRFINRFGFVEIGHICAYLDTSPVTAYARLRKLIHFGYLQHDFVFHGCHGVYRVTRKGTTASGDTLPPLKRIAINQYHHDLKVVSLSLQLIKMHGGDFVTERQLRRDDGILPIGHKGHISDGVLLKDDKRIAIEVELNRKGKRRREKIFNQHVKNFDFDEIWYFCGDEAIYRQVEPYTEKGDLIKCLRLCDYLNDS